MDDSIANLPSGPFLSDIQEKVVQSYHSRGYTCEVLVYPRGYWDCYKGRSRVWVDAMGYDQYVPTYLGHV